MQPSSQHAVYPIVWACLSSWYYGFHLSELNFPVTSLTCLPSTSASSWFPSCLGLDATRYGLVTAIFTVGGFLGSLGSSYVVKSKGMKGGVLWTGYLNLGGVGAMALAPHWYILALGRFVVGLSSGLAVCLVPPFLALIARSSPALANRTGQIGFLNQMGIVIGLFSAQAAGLALTGSKGDIPGNWRYVVLISGAASILQIAVASRVSEPSGEAAKPQATYDEELSAEERDEASPLINRSNVSEAPTSEHQLPLRELLSNTALRGPTTLCAAIMCLQQLSGVNAVMFYSTPVLRPLMPGAAATIGLMITGVNALMTVVALFLVDRLGRKPLLITSILGMALTSAVLAYALDSSLNVISALSIILFIVSFSFGLGPVPFLLISEMAPEPAIPALASLSLSLNWITNFFVASLFLPLRDALSSPADPKDPTSEKTGEGRVFYLFTVVCLGTAVLVSRGLKLSQ